MKNKAFKTFIWTDKETKQTFCIVSHFDMVKVQVTAGEDVGSGFMCQRSAIVGSMSDAINAAR